MRLRRQKQPLSDVQFNLNQRPSDHWAVQRPLGQPQLSKSANAERGDDLDASADAVAIVPEVLRSSGQPLDPATRTFMESRFGHDFSRVRVHTDAAAAASAQTVGASAYTVGRHLAFDQGFYAPHTPQGRRLLAHELAHVVQQDSASALTAGGLRISQPDDAAETEAASVAEKVASGQALSYQPRAATAVLQRQPAAAAATRPRMAEVKRLVRAKDPTPNKELSRLIINNAMDGTPARAAGPYEIVAGAGMHEWQITITLDPGLDRTGAIRAKVGDESAATAGKKVIHTIPISINTFLGSHPEERTAYTDLQDRLDHMAAEGLLHELVHVRLKIGYASPESGQFEVSSTISGLEKERAKVPKVKAEKDAVETEALGLVLIAESVVGQKIIPADRRPAFLKETIDHLVEEKFAKQTAGKPFAITSAITSKAIADAYGNQIERTIRGLAPQPNSISGNNLFNSKIQDLKKAIEKFFDKLDAQP